MIHRQMTLERLEQLKKAEPAIYFHIEEMFQRGTFTRREQKFFRRLINLGNWQLGATCSWFEFDLLRAPYEVQYLEDVMQQWDHIPHAERPAITREAVADRLANLRKEIRRKEIDIERAKEKGCFWSIVPLLEFFDLTGDERARKSCYPLLPSFMQRAYSRMQTPRQPRPGLLARWVENIRRLRLRVFVTGSGGEVDIEHHERGETHEK